MQELINEFFDKLCKNKFFKNDDEEIIGKAKDVIQNLNEQIEYVMNEENEISKEERYAIVDEARKLIQKINNNYSNKDDVIWLNNSPMDNFYDLQEKESLYEELKEYYEGLEERKVINSGRKKWLWRKKAKKNRKV